MKPKKHIITVINGEKTEQAKVDDWPPFEGWDPYAQEALIGLIASIIKNKRSQE